MRVRLPLRLAVSTRALFDLDEDHAVYETQGVEGYVGAQRACEHTLMEKGAGFETIARLLQLNEPAQPPLVDIVVLSRNAPEQ